MSLLGFKNERIRENERDLRMRDLRVRGISVRVRVKKGFESERDFSESESES